MSQSLTLSHNGHGVVPVETIQLMTLSVGKQLFGLPVIKVRDILPAQRIARIPLAPPEVAGALNLRGRIVTAIDCRRRLGLPPRDSDAGGEMNIVVDHLGELYSLIIDSVGEVLTLPTRSQEDVPATLDDTWRGFSSGVYRLEERLLLVLDISQLLEFDGLAPSSRE